MLFPYQYNTWTLIIDNCLRQLKYEPLLLHQELELRSRSRILILEKTDTWNSLELNSSVLVSWAIICYHSSSLWILYIEEKICWLKYCVSDLSLNFWTNLKNRTSILLCLTTIMTTKERFYYFYFLSVQNELYNFDFKINFSVESKLRKCHMDTWKTSKITKWKFFVLEKGHKNNS